MTPRVVQVTVSSLEEGRKIAEALLQLRLCACVNIIPGVESHYRWKEEIQQNDEWLLLIKSSAEQFAHVAEMVRKNHSYECPEIVSFTPEAMAPTYRKWWEDQLA